ncbi:unnamed protein product [Rotaria magnacalcarata]|uniref:Uncharacterized protein n=1 Tax=Rotaria magnacalcarata TaxID=392030 RepID=A0A816ZZW6_9BILA|nr:unnamed protein product [Rotaria magnacalcarata]
MVNINKAYRLIMKKKFRCGRLVINKNGEVKKLELIQGGGTRDCNLTHIDIGFDELHDIIRDVFFKGKSNFKSELYDFQQKKLDTNRYPTFIEYVLKNGLKFNNTLLYLCTQQDNDFPAHSPSPEKRKKPSQVKQTPTRVDNRTPLVEADSSTSPILIKIEDISQSNQISTNEFIPPSNHIAENLESFSSMSFSSYSFEKTLNEFVNYLRQLINQYNHEHLFVQLFEHMCTVRGLSSINLDRLKQQAQSIDENQKQIYNEILDKIDQSSRSFKALIELNKVKISHIDQHSIIMNTFTQFHRNFNTLHDQWKNHLSNKKQSTFLGSTTHGIDPKLTTSSPSSSSRPSSEQHCRKQARALSPSPQRSSSRQHSEYNTRKQARIHSPLPPPPPPSQSSSSSRNYLDASYRNQVQAQSPSSRGPSSSSRYHSENHSKNPAHVSSTSSRNPSENDFRTQLSSPRKSSSRYHHSETNTQTQKRALLPTPREASSSRYHSESYSKNQAHVSLSSRNHSENDSRTQTRTQQPSPRKSSSRNYSETNSHKQTRSPRKSSSRNHSETNFREQAPGQPSSSSSYRHHSETKHRTQVRSPPLHQSSSRISLEDDTDRKRTLFQDILKSLDYLLDVLHRLRFTSFINLVESIVGEIKACRSTLKLSDYRSVHDAEQIIISIERHLANRMRDEDHRASPHGVDQSLEHAFNNTLDSIRDLLNSLTVYQSQTHKNKQPKKTRWSSPNIPSSVEVKVVDIKPMIDSNQDDSKIEDDQSSEASHSSLGDEILMEVARDAYEKRPNRLK